MAGSRLLLSREAFVQIAACEVEPIDQPLDEYTVVPIIYGTVR